MLFSVCFRRRKEHSHLTCLRDRRRQIWSSPPRPRHKTCFSAVKTVPAFSPRVGFLVHWEEALAVAHLWVRASLHAQKKAQHTRKGIYCSPKCKLLFGSKYEKIATVVRSVSWFCGFFFCSVVVISRSKPCVCRYSVQLKLHRAVRGPGHSDEGHPGGPENAGADPAGTAAASPAGHGGEAVGPDFSGPQQLQERQG